MVEFLLDGIKQVRDTLLSMANKEENLMIRQPKYSTRNVNDCFYEFEKRQIALLNEVLSDVELTKEEEQQMCNLQGINEQLKAQDQIRWIRLKNNIRDAAEEIVLTELIYV